MSKGCDFMKVDYRDILYATACFYHVYKKIPKDDSIKHIERIKTILEGSNITIGNPIKAIDMLEVLSVINIRWFQNGIFHGSNGFTSIDIIQAMQEPNAKIYISRPAYNPSKFLTIPYDLPTLTIIPEGKSVEEIWDVYKENHSVIVYGEFKSNNSVTNNDITY